MRNPTTQDTIYLVQIRFRSRIDDVTIKDWFTAREFTPAQFEHASIDQIVRSYVPPHRTVHVDYRVLKRVAETVTEGRIEAAPRGATS